MPKDLTPASLDAVTTARNALEACDGDVKVTIRGHSLTLYDLYEGLDQALTEFEESQEPEDEEEEDWDDLECRILDGEVEETEWDKVEARAMDGMIPTRGEAHE